MAQEKITFNSVEIKQPKKGWGIALKPLTDDSTRVQSGVLHTTPLFTVESFSYSAKWLTIAEMKTILQIVAKGRYFKMHYFSPYYGNGRDGHVLCGQRLLSIGTLQQDKERYESLSFNIVGVNPI